ncbi:MAG: AAA family ATPase [Lentisphaeria bacterium]|nr:AAA family ATPase [Lentisphaeria bacterium]
MMFTLEQIEIDGFWGRLSLNSSLFPDVNIFIGQNGTGKTTLMNALQAVLTVDLVLLEKTEFDQIRLRLIDGKKSRTVTVTRITSDLYFETVNFKISRKTYRLPLVPRDVEYRRRITSRFLEDIRAVRKQMSSMIRTSWLSVHREILQEEDYEYHMRGRRVEKVLNPVDSRLADLMERLTAYQLNLQSQASELSATFQKQVLTSILYNKKFDTFDLDDQEPMDLAELREHLTRTYADLGALSENTVKRIDEHVSKLEESLSKLRMAQDSKEPFYVNDVLPLSLYRRSRHLADLSTRVDVKKKDLFRLFNLFLETLHDFAQDKIFEQSSSGDGGLKITKKGQSIFFQQLSSGEKQLLILLAEALLQDRGGAVFIADEPELSLHPTWQGKLLGAIRALNQNVQLIVATHAPEIASQWPDNIIDMEDVLS